MNPINTTLTLSLLAATACGARPITHDTMDLSVVNHASHELTVVAEESCWNADTHTFDVAAGGEDGVEHKYTCHGEENAYFDRVTITFADYQPTSSTFYTFDTASYLPNAIGVGANVTWLEDGELKSHAVTSSDTGYSEIGSYVQPSTSFAVSRTSVHIVPARPDAAMKLGIAEADYPQYVPRPTTAEVRDGFVFLPMTKRTYTFKGKGTWRNSAKGGPIELVCDDYGCRGGSL